jgi:hypothetical protein
VAACGGGWAEWGKIQGKLILKFSKTFEIWQDFEKFYKDNYKEFGHGVCF